jgi:hypothetical protein
MYTNLSYTLVTVVEEDKPTKALTNKDFDKLKRVSISIVYDFLIIIIKGTVQRDGLG